jgi:formylglycine-generating enzyme required for sulfatase activity
VGSYLLTVGSPQTEQGRRVNEPEHEVAMRWQADELLAWGHEVTQAEYEALMGSNPSVFSGADLPVENVTWLDAVRYCNALSGDSLEPAYTIMGDAVTWNLDADGWRLPTEAEWELLCRAGTTTAFANGDLADWACGSNPDLDAIGWYCGNAGATTHAVAGKTANAWGLQDMHGNVAEWCWDRYTDTPGPSFDGPSTGEQRVIRGGDWYYHARDCRSAARTGLWANSGTDRVGFRVVRTHR